MNSKFKIFCLFTMLLIILLFFLPSSGQKVKAQAGCQTGQGATGLISAPSITGFGNNIGGVGVCNQDPSSAFVTQKIPTYEKLKSRYFTQVKQTSSVTKHAPLIGDKTQADLIFLSGSDHVYYIQKTTPYDGNLTISANMAGTTALVIVDGNLNINSNLCYSTTCPAGTPHPTSGIVFVVRGNVYISPSVTRIDAIIISEGSIYTAASSSDLLCNKNTVLSDPLVINGSLISLEVQKPIVFCRTLRTGNTAPSEQINHQVKYLVILRNLLSDTWQRWSEIQ